MDPALNLRQANTISGGHQEADLSGHPHHGGGHCSSGYGEQECGGEEAGCVRCYGLIKRLIEPAQLVE